VRRTGDGVRVVRKILLGRIEITADVADTDDTRRRGLMDRESLGPRAGMLFVFDEPARYPFWMRHVKMPLDIPWIDAAGRIVWMVESAPPCAAEPCLTYVPGAEASYVLEVEGGFARRHAVRAGDVVIIS